ncbi:hypothetical protein ZTR_09240 [Talaromyces verruculosus]|nr:hypothetical protein ZTR_09240 [Talaromyces verruculosus]
MEQSVPYSSMLSDELSEIADAISTAQAYVMRMEDYVSQLSSGLAGCRSSIAVINEKVQHYMSEQNYFKLRCDNTSLREKAEFLTRAINKYQVTTQTLRRDVERLEKSNRDLQLKLSMACRHRATLDDLATAATLEDRQSVDGTSLISHFSDDTDSTSDNAVSGKQSPLEMAQQQGVPKSVAIKCE